MGEAVNTEIITQWRDESQDPWLVLEVGMHIFDFSSNPVHCAAEHLNGSLCPALQDLSQSINRPIAAAALWSGTVPRMIQRASRAFALRL